MEHIKTFIIRNKLGIHARAAAKIVKVAMQFKSRIFLEKDGVEINAKSLLGILTLACPMGSHLIVRTEGTDAPDALKAMEQLIENKFDED